MNAVEHALVVGDKDPRENWLPYARALRERGLRVTLLFYYRNERVNRHTELEEGISEIVLSQPDCLPEPEDTLLSEWEGQYKIRSMPQYVFTECYLYDLPYRIVAGEFTWLMPQLERIFEENEFTLVLQNQGAGLLRRGCVSICEAKSIPNIFFDVSWFGDRMFLPGNEMNTVEEYEPLSLERIAPDVLDRVKQFRADQLERRPQYQYQFPTEERVTLVARARETLAKFRRKNLKKAVSYRLLRAQKQWRRLLVELFVERKALKAAPGGEAFFYFPLHYPRDSQLTLRNQLFLRQEALVEYISWNLPHGTRLLVKPHPQAKGDYELSALSQIQALERCEIVSAKVSSHDLMSHPNCNGVIVLNSSVGFESLLHSVPVIAVGNFYGLHYPGALYNITPERLAETLSTVMKAPRDEDAFTGVLGSIYTAAYPGTAYAAEVDYGKVIDSVLAKRAFLTGAGRKS